MLTGKLCISLEIISSFSCNNLPSQTTEETVILKTELLASIKALDFQSPCNSFLDQICILLFFPHLPQIWKTLLTFPSFYLNLIWSAAWEERRIGFLNALIGFSLLLPIKGVLLLCLVSFFALKKGKVWVTLPSFKNAVAGFSKSIKLLR